MKPGIYRAGDVHGGWGADDGGPVPVADLEEGVRLQLTEESYLRIGLDPQTGELDLHASGRGTEHILFRSVGGNTAAIRVELRSGTHYLGQAPEPRGDTAVRERTREIDGIRIALQNAGPKGVKRGLNAEEARALGDRLHDILTNPKRGSE